MPGPKGSPRTGLRSRAAAPRDIAAGIEVRHLRYAIAAAEAGSFRGAAATLNVEQSVLSRRIRELEDELGVTLFTRQYGGVCLTQAGERFVIRARKVLDQIRDAATYVGSRNHVYVRTGTIRIGIFSSISSGFLSELLRIYVTDGPCVWPELIEGTPVSQMGAVQRHHLDVAFVPDAHIASNLEAKCLWRERIYVVLPCDHDLVVKDELSWEDLREQAFVVRDAGPGPEVHSYLVERLGRIGYCPRVDRQAVGRDNLMQLVAMRRGLTLTSEAATANIFPGVTYRPLRGEVWCFSAVWSRRNLNPALKRLLRLADRLAKGQPEDEVRTS